MWTFKEARSTTAHEETAAELAPLEEAKVTSRRRRRRFRIFLPGRAPATSLGVALSRFVRHAPADAACYTQTVWLWNPQAIAGQQGASV